MRLACPNCGAEYEVPDGLVPEGGKHVQCTDCDTRWFVRGGRDAVVSEDQLIERLENWRPRLVTSGGIAPGTPRATQAPTAVRPVAEPEPAPPAPAPASEAETGTAPDASPLSAKDDEAPEEAHDPIADGPPEDFVWEDSQGAVAPPELDASVIQPRESTPTPTPPAAAPMFQPVRAPEPGIAPERNAEPTAATASKPSPAAIAGSEDDADIEDVRPIRNRTRNSQRIELPENGARAVETPGPTPEPGRFRTGLVVALALFALAFLVYAARDAIVATVPAVEPVLSGYAGAVDGMREGIDRIIAPDG